jgi:hypothetical protein
MSKKNPQSSAFPLADMEKLLDNGVKAILTREGIVSGKFSDPMEAKDVYGLCLLFKEYQFDKFKCNLTTYEKIIPAGIRNSEILGIPEFPHRSEYWPAFTGFISGLFEHRSCYQEGL